MGGQPTPASGAEAFSDLERFLEAAATAHAGLGEVERGSERRGREMVRLMLQAHVDARGNGDVGRAIVIGEAPLRLAYKRVRSRRILTVFGELTLTRTGYGQPGERTVYPLDRELQLPERTYSYEYQRRLMRTVVGSPFDEAIALLAELTGVRVPKR